VIVVAHRGCSDTAPENTLAAFRRAVEEGADMIELDARMSRDGELVVIHDRTVQRTTDGRGAVDALTLGELQHLDAGSWFSRRFAGERIPTLRQVLGFLPATMQLNIEMKPAGGSPAIRALAGSVVRLVREYGCGHRTIISSFDHRVLRYIHKLEPGLNIGALYWPVRDLGRDPSWFQRSFGAMTFGCSHAQLRKRWVADAHRHGMRVACYTVNTQRHLRKVQKYGVDAAITNSPGKLRQWL
jgi:glycerophosphoryl diester phosphodiesterase